MSSKSYRLIFASHSFTCSPSSSRKENLGLHTGESICDNNQSFTNSTQAMAVGENWSEDWWFEITSGWSFFSKRQFWRCSFIFFILWSWQCGLYLRPCTPAFLSSPRSCVVPCFRPPLSPWCKLWNMMRNIWKKCTKRSVIFHENVNNSNWNSWLGLQSTIIYTLLQGKRWRWCSPPPPPISFEGLNWSQQTIYIIGKGIYQRLRFILDIGKYSDFATLWATFAKCFAMVPECCPKKRSNF